MVNIYGAKITIFSAETPLPAGLAKAAANGATGPDAAARLAGQHAAHRALIPPAGVKHGQKRREDGINDSVNRRVKGRRHCRPSGAPDGGGEEGLWELGLGLLPWAISLSNVGAGTTGEERRRGMVRASQMPSGMIFSCTTISAGYAGAALRTLRAVRSFQCSRTPSPPALEHDRAPASRAPRSWRRRKTRA